MQHARWVRMTAPSIADYFAEQFGDAPDVIASAAGRVNLLGEHVDYNGGEVLPIAIERRTQVAIRPRLNGNSRTVSANEEDEGAFDAAHPVKSGNWWDYIAGVAAALRDDGIVLPNTDIGVMSDVPIGAGLSSSAAIEVATATAFAALSRQIGAAKILSAKECARAAWRAETRFVGVPCGIMDQFASALGQPGHALHLWCDTEETEQVPFTEDVLIFDTRVSRSLRQSDFAQRRAECEEALALLRRHNPTLPNLAAATPEEVIAADLPEPLDKRALHVSEETRRVQQAVQSLRETGSIPGDLLYQSHESLRGLYQCSTPELDWFVENVAKIDGVGGARLTGAGWGGCAIAIGSRQALDTAVQELPQRYETKFGVAPRTWLTRASMGAQLELSHVPSKNP